MILQRSNKPNLAGNPPSRIIAMRKALEYSIPGMVA